LQCLHWNLLLRATWSDVKKEFINDDFDRDFSIAIPLATITATTNTKTALLAPQITCTAIAITKVNYNRNTKLQPSCHWLRPQQSHENDSGLNDSAMRTKIVLIASKIPRYLLPVTQLQRILKRFCFLLNGRISSLVEFRHFGCPAQVI